MPCDGWDTLELVAGTGGRSLTINGSLSQGAMVWYSWHGFPKARALVRLWSM